MSHVPNLSSSKLFDSQINRFARVTPVGGLLTEQTMKLAGGGFFTPIDSNQWIVTNSGTGSSSGVSDNKAILTSGTANTGYATVESSVPGRFFFASANLFRGSYRIQSTDGAGNLRKWGAFNFEIKPAISDGFYFQYDGDSSTLSVNAIKSGVITATAKSGEFNGEVQTYTLNTTAHNFEIVYQVAQVWFFVDGVLLHRLALGTNFLSGDYSLRASAVSVNTSTNSRSLEVWAGSIVRLGSASPSAQFVNCPDLGTHTVKLGAGTLHRIIINAAGSNANTVTLYDSTTDGGTIIAKIKNNLGTIGDLTYNLDFHAGLVVVQSSGSPTDLTVVYD